MEKSNLHPRPNRTVCSKCLKTKPSEEFETSTWCAKCRRGYYKEYNKKRYATPGTRDAELAKSKKLYWTEGGIRWQRVNRKRQLILMVGGKCVRCGYNRSAAALDFHHIDRTTKGRGISQLLAIQQPWGFEAAVEEAKKCELICSNCHREETWPGHELALPEANF
jgi:hypothetical protein